MRLHTEAEALEMLGHMIKWSLRGALDWPIGPVQLKVDNFGDVNWSIKPSIGGPVEVTHRCLPLESANLKQLADSAKVLAEFATEVDRYSGERADFEDDMRKAAKAMVRRKGAKGIRLVDVVSQPIPADYYQGIGVEVTFAWGPKDGGQSVTFEVDDIEELEAEFGALLVDLETNAFRLAA